MVPCCVVLGVYCGQGGTRDQMRAETETKLKQIENRLLLEFYTSNLKPSITVAIMLLTVSPSGASPSYIAAAAGPKVVLINCR